MRASAATLPTKSSTTDMRFCHIERIVQPDNTVSNCLPGNFEKQQDTHAHSADEKCLILEGEGHIGDINLRAGDLHLAPAGLAHGETYGRNGRMLYIRTNDKEYRAGL